MVGQDDRISAVHLNTLPARSVLSGTLSRNQKYKKMSSLCQKLAMISSQCGMSEFRDKFATIQELVELWEEGGSCVIVPKDGKAGCDPSQVTGEWMKFQRIVVML